MSHPMMERFYVNVQPIKAGSWGKHCRIAGNKQRCGRKPTFIVFNLDGKPKSSRLDSVCCVDHLPRAVRVAFRENQKHKRESEEAKP